MSVWSMVSAEWGVKLAGEGKKVLPCNYPGMEKDYMMLEEHAGCVLSMYERNGYDDSDFYAVVWDDAAGAPKHVMYATTRGWTYANGANVDASPEVLAKHKAWEAAVRAADKARAEAKESATPRPGKSVKVVAGRKLPHGTVAEVFWYGANKFGGSRYSYAAEKPMRVGLKLASGEKVFVDAKNVAVVAEAELAVA